MTHVVFLPHSSIPSRQRPSRSIRYFANTGFAGNTKTFLTGDQPYGHFDKFKVRGMALLSMQTKFAIQVVTRSAAFAASVNRKHLETDTAIQYRLYFIALFILSTVDMSCHWSKELVEPYGFICKSVQFIGPYQTGIQRQQ